MYIFKTSGATFDSVIRNQKHAFKNEPQDWAPGEIVLVSKNKRDCTPNEKQISFTMRLNTIRKTTDYEIEKYWPGNAGRWDYIVDCTGTEPVPTPFNLADILGAASQAYNAAISYRKVEPHHEALIVPLLAGPSTNSPDEITSPKQYVEGTCRNITVNAYERDPAARDACIAHYGLSCQICNFNFEEGYGELGAGFIHVHHIVPLADIGKEYTVDPITDLIPLCANCHAMIHRRKPALTVEELEQYIAIHTRSL
jgi:hypothetical protein